MRNEIRQAILSAEAVDADPSWDPAQGHSGSKVLALLANLARVALDDPSKCYVEIGVFRGLTLSAVAKAAPDRAVFGIDNFSYGDEGNERQVLDRLAAQGSTNATLLKGDYEAVLPTLGERIGKRRVGLFLVDGPHDYRSQLMCLLLARHWLSDDAIVVIDDCNYEHVRLATKDFIASDPACSLVMQAYTPRHPVDSTGEELRASRRGWWNGIHVLARGTAAGPSLSVPVGDARRRCENEHYLHSSRFAMELQGLNGFAESSLTDSPLAFIKRALTLRRQFRGDDALLRLQPNGNMRTAGLKPFEVA